MWKNLGTAGQATNIHFWSYLDELYLERQMFRTKVVEKIKPHILCSVNVFLKSRRLRDNVENLCTAGQATNIHFWSYLGEFYLKREMLQTKVVEKIKTHILCSVTFPRKLCRLRDNVEKLGTAGQATNIHYWSYLGEFYLKREMFQTKVVEKIKTHIFCSVTFPRKPCCLWDNVGKNILWSRTDHRCKHGACVWHAVITNTRDTRSENVIFIAFTREQWSRQPNSSTHLSGSSIRLHKLRRYVTSCSRRQFRNVSFEGVARRKSQSLHM